MTASPAPPRIRPARAAAIAAPRARTLFAERRFHATTRELAAAADVNDALLYRYFPDKQAILEALADEAIAVFRALPTLPDQAPLPLAQLPEPIGTGLSVRVGRAVSQRGRCCLPMQQGAGHGDGAERVVAAACALHPAFRHYPPGRDRHARPSPQNGSSQLSLARARLLLIQRLTPAR